jgi:hypothetical protein
MTLRPMARHAVRVVAEHVVDAVLRQRRRQALAPRSLEHRLDRHLGLYPIVTLQYSSTPLYQVSYHIQCMFY